MNKPVGQIIHDAGINDDTLMFAAEEARKLMDGYVPMDTGRLADTAEVSVIDGKGRVYYPQEYAAVCYYGEKLRFNTEKHQKAAAFWDRAMIQAHKSELAGVIQGYIKR